MLDEMAIAGLRRDGFAKQDIAAAVKFGHLEALLYALIGVQGAVSTPDGQGTLVNVQNGACRVQLLRGKTRKFSVNAKGVRPTQDFLLEDVRPHKISHR